MKLIIDIPEEIMEYIKNNGCLSVVYNDGVAKAIINGTPLPDITNEQISEAFQIAIANYWEEKSKHLTPPPTPAQCCDCPNKKEGEE